MSRLDRSRAFEQAVGQVPEFCDACGGPRTDLPFAIPLRDGERIGECPTCRGATCPDGRSARKLTTEGENRIPLVTYVDRKPTLDPGAA